MTGLCSHGPLNNLDTADVTSAFPIGLKDGRNFEGDDDTRRRILSGGRIAKIERECFEQGVGLNDEFES